MYLRTTSTAGRRVRTEESDLQYAAPRAISKLVAHKEHSIGAVIMKLAVIAADWCFSKTFQELAGGSFHGVKASRIFSQKC